MKFIKSTKCWLAMTLATVISTFSINALAVPLVFEWSANLSVVTGNEVHLPAGVSDGDMIMGTIGWDLDDPHPVSFSNPGSSPEVANYKSDSWSLDLGGGIVYSRTLTDGLGVFGIGGIQIRNDDDTVADGLTLNDTFTFQNSLGSLTPPVNEFTYRLRLIDDDRTVFEDFVYNGIFPYPNVPDALDLSVFEHTILTISKIVYDSTDDRYRKVLVAETGLLKSFTFSAVPIPATIWLFGTALIGLAGFSKRRKTT